MWRKDFHSSAAITPFDMISDSLPGLIFKLNDNEQARDVAYFSVISFADEVREVLPLTRVREVGGVMGLTKGVETDYQAIFSHLAKFINADVERLSITHDLYVPAVFFLTDGQPQVKGNPQPDTSWLPELEKLRSLVEPTVIALGFGASRASCLEKIASRTPPGAACIAEHGVHADKLLSAVLNSIIFSITASATAGSLIFETPAGMRRLS